MSDEPAFSNIDRPAFQSSDHEMELASPKLSIVALVAFIAGIFSLLAPMSQIGLPICVVAVFVGVVSLIRIGRDPDLGGALLGQVGIMLGIATFIWATMAREGNKDYFYQVAGSHAERFVELLADESSRYQAFELLRAESDRQMSGTNLEEYYAKADEETKSAIESFMSNNVTEHIMAVGKEADWKFKSGVEMTGAKGTHLVWVSMSDKSGKGKDFEISLQRITGLLAEDEGLPTAHWSVYDLRFP